MKLILAAFFLLVFHGGPYNPGDIVGNFSLMDGVSGKEVSLVDFSGSKAVIVVFSSMVCPYSRLNEQRLVQMAGQYSAKGLSMVFINPNVGHEDETELNMKEYANSHNINFPFLRDPGGRIARKFKAGKTPEAFLLQPGQSGFVLRYKGAVDNSPQSAQDASEKYLENALVAILNGTPVVVKETRVIGCVIKF